TKALDIEGLGADQLPVSGNDASRVFQVSATGADVTLAGLAITFGRADQGGGVLTSGANLTIAGCRLFGNQATSSTPGGSGLGGGLYIASGIVAIRDSAVSTNQATGGGGHPGGLGAGGGVYVASGTVALDDSEVSNNQAAGGFGTGTTAGGPGSGGGIYVAGGSVD